MNEVGTESILDPRSFMYGIESVIGKKPESLTYLRLKQDMFNTKMPVTFKSDAMNGGRQKWSSPADVFCLRLILFLSLSANVDREGVRSVAPEKFLHRQQRRRRRHSQQCRWRYWHLLNVIHIECSQYFWILWPRHPLWANFYSYSLLISNCKING